MDATTIRLIAGIAAVILLIIVIWRRTRRAIK